MSLSLATLRVKIFADGADKAGMLEMARKPYIAGFTTNPTLMRKAGVVDYRAFAREIVGAIPDRPISFEVFADEFAEMERQAHEMASWGELVYVKVPVTNTRGEPACGLIRRLSKAGVKLNVTALMRLDQVRSVRRAGGRAFELYFGVRWKGRRHWPRSRAADGRRGRTDAPLPSARADLGQPARDPEHLSGRCDRVPYYHRHPRYSEEARSSRQGLGRILARYR